MPYDCCSFQPTPPDALDEAPGYRVSDPETSKEAFDQVNVNERELQVLESLLHLGGQASDEEIADWLSRTNAREEPCSNVSPRVAQLKRKGFLSTCTYKLKSRQGRMCRVTKLTDKGFAAVGGIAHE